VPDFPDIHTVLCREKQPPKQPLTCYCNASRLDLIRPQGSFDVASHMNPLVPNAIATRLEALVSVAEAALSRSAADRDDASVALQAVVIASLALSIAQARCVLSAISSSSARGALPNVRAMFEALVTARYLADPYGIK
jgi:hypothetical protein